VNAVIVPVVVNCQSALSDGVAGVVTVPDASVLPDAGGVSFGNSAVGTANGIGYLAFPFVIRRSSMYPVYG
jgi:hypothetical protein